MILDIPLLLRFLFIVNHFQPQPVVDAAKESEKCCNTQLHLPGKKLLRVYENISSALANVAQVCIKTIRIQQ